MILIARLLLSVRYRAARAALVIGASAGAIALGSASCGLDARGAHSGDVASASSGAGGGSGGNGGAGGSPDLICFPLSSIPCYDGPEGTLDVGVCHEGQKLCAPDGMSYGQCSGEIVPGPEDCVSDDDEDCDKKGAACTGDHVWSRALGGTNYDAAVAVTVDKDDNVIVTGIYRGAAAFGGQMATSVGDADIFVAKYKPDGTFIWSRSFGGAEYDAGLTIKTDAQGYVFVAGTFRGSINFGFGPFKSGGGDDIFVTKLSPAGDVMFAKHFGEDGDQYASGLALTPDGGLVVVGGFTGSVGFDPGAPTFTSVGSADMYIAKFDGEGHYEWSKQYGDVSPQSLDGVAASANGHIVVVGQASGTFNVGPFEVKTSNYDVFAAGFDEGGGVLYARSFGDVSEQGAYGVAVDPQGSAFIAGDFQGKIMFDAELSADGFDTFVAELSPSGDPIWSRSIGGMGDQRARGLARDPFGNILILGSSFNTLNIDPKPLMSPTRDVFIAKLKPTGEGVWAKLVGDDLAWEQYGNDVASDSQGDAVVVGDFDSSMNFAGAPIMSAGSRDGFVAKLAP